MDILILVWKDVFQFLLSLYYVFRSVFGFPWISKIIPRNFLVYIAPVSLIIIGLIVDRHYVGRVQIFTNSIALNILVFSKENFLLMSMGSFFPLFALYTNVGLILGLVGIFSYTEKIKVGSFYYYVSGLYSSELTGAIILIIILVSNSII